MELDEYEPLRVQVDLKNYLKEGVNFFKSLNSEDEVLIIPEICLTEVKIKKSFFLDWVYFEFASAVLTEESSKQLDTLVRIMQENPNLEIKINAHADSKDSSSLNMKLSENRARSVLDYLLAKGIAASRMVSKEYGETQPLELNTNPDGTDNPEGRARNRRCAFTILKF